MWVKNVRPAPIRRAAATAWSSEKCDACGRSRSASTTTTSSPSSSGHEASGMAQQSVR